MKKPVFVDLTALYILKYFAASTLRSFPSAALSMTNLLNVCSNSTANSAAVFSNAVKISFIS
ncbi:MAG: hypothetical protein J6W23_01330, partial [Victivallales bacterium]|nr:hypothetical protein [Victivallales bacterium]